jgi:SAM-dependent methyltransferase
MKLDALQKHWETFARQDPMWAILTDPGKQGRAWNEAEFYATGVGQILDMLSWVRWVLPLAKFDRAIDFGCGIGRLTQALADHAGHVTGVDIAPTMIEIARRNNAKPNCEFVCNERPDLSLFADASLDFIYTSITLQHRPAQGFPLGRAERHIGLRSLVRKASDGNARLCGTRDPRALSAARDVDRGVAADRRRGSRVAGVRVSGGQRTCAAGGEMIRWR